MSKNPLSLNRSDLFSLSALAISIVALLVSMYEAGIMKDQQKIMKEQHEIMFSQQQAAVWPYVEGSTAYQLGGRFRMTFSIINKGVGPALIKDGSLHISGAPLSDFEGDIYKALRPYFPDSLRLNISLSLVSNQVLSAGEEYRILTLESPSFTGDGAIAKQLDISYTGCYCSIYEDCWQLKRKQDGGKIKCEE